MVYCVILIGVSIILSSPVTSQGGAGLRTKNPRSEWTTSDLCKCQVCTETLYSEVQWHCFGTFYFRVQFPAVE